MSLTPQDFLSKWKRAAYGWPETLPDEEILEKLLVLNLEQAGQSTEGSNVKSTT